MCARMNGLLVLLASERKQLHNLATETRDILDRVIEASGYYGSTAGTRIGGTCLYACLLLRTALKKFAACSATIHGGGETSGTGLVCPDGTLCGHYWIQGTAPSGAAFLCDITADQFGYERIVLLDNTVSWAHYRPDAPAVIATHVADVLQDLARLRAPGLPA